METRALVVGQCSVVSLPPGELEPHTEGLIQIPEQVAIESAVADSSRGGDIAVDRIIDPVAYVAVQARRPVEKTFQPATGRPNSLQRIERSRQAIDIYVLKNAAVVVAECLTGVHLTHHSEAVCHFPTEVGT
jgi:hypothetical protein